MRISRSPHPWRVSPARAIAIQRALATRVWAVPLAVTPRLVAGVDAAFPLGGRRVVAAAVLWDAERREVVEERVAERRLTFPYVPGLLSFREAPAVLAALRALRRAPDVIMCDAHGLAHPRRFGLACHVGVICGIPTIGCAKSRLIGVHGEPGTRRGSRSDLLDPRDRRVVIGSVLRTRDGVKPVYVSIGHLIDLASAEEVVLRCGGGYRLPEPTRRADRAVGRIG
jgi:deoxyribonuclease V